MSLLLPFCGPIALVLILGLTGFEQPATQTKGQVIEYPEDLSEETIRRLDKWVKGTSENHLPSSLRDIFGKNTVAAPGSHTTAPLPPNRPIDAAEPVLKGFVFTRGGQGHPQALAAIDYEEQMFLVGAGDTVGSYRVERVEEGEAVLLVDDTTGEKLELTLN